jgi:hypothetical protein
LHEFHHRLSVHLIIPRDLDGGQVGVIPVEVHIILTAKPGLDIFLLQKKHSETTVTPQ